MARLMWAMRNHVLFFQVFNHGDQQFLSRGWQSDPGEVQAHEANATTRGEKEPWNGEFYVSFGADQTRESIRRF